MNVSTINKILHKCSIIVLICGLLFIIAGLIIFIYGYNLYKNDTNPVYLNDIIKDNDSENKYSYINLIGVSSFATKGDDNTYYFVIDNDKYFYIVNMSESTYLDIYKKSLNMGDNFEYELYGYATKITDDIKESAIVGFNKLDLGITLSDDNFEDEMGIYYLDSILKVDLGIDYFYLIFGGVIGLFGIILSLIYFISLIRRHNLFSKYDYDKIYKELNSSDVIYIKNSNLVLTKNYVIFKNIYDIKDIIWIYEEDNRLLIYMKDIILNIYYNEELFNKLSNNKNILVGNTNTNKNKYLKKKENRN